MVDQGTHARSLLARVDKWVWKCVNRLAYRNNLDRDELHQDSCVRILSLASTFDPAKGSAAKWAMWQCRQVASESARRATLAMPTLTDLNLLADRLADDEAEAVDELEEAVADLCRAFGIMAVKRVLDRLSPAYRDSLDAYYMSPTEEKTRSQRNARGNAVKRFRLLYDAALAG